MNKPSTKTSFMSKMLARNVHILILSLIVGTILPLAFDTRGWLIGLTIFFTALLFVGFIIYSLIDANERPKESSLIGCLVTPMVLISSLFIIVGGIRLATNHHISDLVESAEEDVEQCQYKLSETRALLEIERQIKRFKCKKY